MIVISIIIITISIVLFITSAVAAVYVVRNWKHLEGWNNHTKELQKDIGRLEEEKERLIQSKDAAQLEAQKANSEYQEILKKNIETSDGLHRMAAQYDCLNNEIGEMQLIKAELEDNIKRLGRRLDLMNRGDADEDGRLWYKLEPLSAKEEELLRLTRRLAVEWPVLAVDMGTIAWKRVWQPRIQALERNQGIWPSGVIYEIRIRPKVKMDADGQVWRRYVGQAQDVMDRWKTHLKKMCGAVASVGREKLYGIIEEWGGLGMVEIEWCILEDGLEKGRGMNEAEQDWIEREGELNK